MDYNNDFQNEQGENNEVSSADIPTANEQKEEPNVRPFSYCDTSSNYMPYGYYAHSAPAAEMKKSKNKKLGVLIAALIVFVSSLILFLIMFMIYIKTPAPSEEPTTEKSTANAQIIMGTAEGVTPEQGSAGEIYQKTYKSNVGVLVYANQPSYSGSQSAIASEGSGVILPTIIDGKDNGKTYIVTCAHVVSTSSNYKTVIQLYDGTQYDAEIVGVDKKTDIGVLSIDATGLQTIEFAPSSAVLVGDTVYALGNPGGSTFFGTFTNGIVSAIGRPVNSPVGYEVACIQHTAPINPGNSGGALLNANGQLIGINSSKIASTDYEGMGFSVPSEIVKQVVEDIISSGYVTGRAKLGLGLATLSQSQVHWAVAIANDLPAGTVIIATVSQDFVQSGKEVKQGDMIVAANGKNLDTVNVLLDEVEKGSVGDSLTLTICRIESNYKVTSFDITVTLIEDKGEN